MRLVPVLFDIESGINYSAAVRNKYQVSWWGFPYLLSMT